MMMDQDWLPPGHPQYPFKLSHGIRWGLMIGGIVCVVLLLGLTLLRISLYGA